MWPDSPHPRRIAQSFSAVTRTSNTTTDSSFSVIKQVTVPGSVMGLDSKLVVVTDWDVLTTGTKTVAFDFGGSNVFWVDLSGTTTTFKGLAEIQNKHSLSAQTIFAGSAYQIQPTARTATTVDTTADVTIDIKCKWSANQADSLQTISLIGYSIWHYPGS